MEVSVESNNSHNVEEAIQMEGSNQHLTGGIMTVIRPDSPLGDVIVSLKRDEEDARELMLSSTAVWWWRKLG